jgi:hypothetical protein
MMSHVTSVSPRPAGPRVWGVLVFLLFAVLYVASASQERVTINNDVSTGGIGAWRIAETGQPWLDDAQGELTSMVRDDTWVGSNADNGRPVASRSPGVVAASVPASLIAQRVLGQDDFSPAPQAVTAALLTAAAVTLLFLALRTRLSHPRALLATVAFGCATPVWSVAANALWPHTLTILGVTGMAWASSQRRWALAGLFGGLALWGRLHATLIVAAVGLGVSVYRRQVRPVIVVGALSLLALSLASVWSLWVYGSWLPSGGYGANPLDRAVNSSYRTAEGGYLSNLAGFLVSPGFGLLVWTPALVICVPAVVRGWRDCPDWAKSLVLGGLAYTLFQVRINTFTGGQGFYGYRHGLELLVCLTPCIAFSLHRAGRWARAMLPPLLALQFAVIALGSVFDGGFVGRERAWSANAFVLIVREAPAIGVLAVLIAAGVWLAWRSTTAQTWLTADVPAHQDVVRSRSD